MINYALCETNTDKFSGGLVNNNKKGHNYQLLYKNFINKNLKYILEIGTANGGFAKFLIDNDIDAFAVGTDLIPDAEHFHVSDTTNYNHLYSDFYVGDSFTLDFLEWIREKQYKFDLVIEDAEHVISQQIFMAANVNKLLNDGGVYICEDVQSYVNANIIMESIPVKYKKYSYIWDASKSIGRSDDICVVIDTR